MAGGRFLERVVYYPGQTIIREGEEGTRAYLIDSGEVTITKKMADGSQTIIATIGKGAIFGEMALIDDQPRVASVSASRQTVCFVITRRDFQKKLQECDPFIRGLLTIFVARIRNIIHSIATDAPVPSIEEGEGDEVALAS